MATAQNKIYLTSNGETRSVTLADNSATSKLKELLMESDITVDMSDYGGWEKVGDLPQSLPTSNSQITAQPGDIMLYQGYQMVIFYGNNSWSYTRLGKVDNSSDLKAWLGNDDVKVTLSLNYTSGIENIAMDNDIDDKVFDMMGRPVNHRPLAPGLYIINGKKTLVK